MSSQQTKSYKYLIYFVTAFISCYLTQEILLTRLISVGWGYITGGTFVYFTSPLIIDVVAEVYGYKVARQILWCGLFATLFMALCIAILIRVPYPAFWSNVITAYNTALGSIPRVAIVSSITILIGQLINAYLISKWKILMRGRYFWLRSLSSSIIGDSVTVTLSIIGIFSGQFTVSMLTANIVPELIVMVLFTSIGAIPAAFLAKMVAKAEGLNNYDVGVNFNPFRLKEEN